MMADYIDRSKVLDLIKDKADGYPYFEYPTINLVHAIKDIPSADVMEVRHGEWLEKETFHDENADVISEWQSARCSVCNKYNTTPYLYYFTDYNFCPNCGADMRGGI